jgi:hypothetical protein
MRNLGMLVIVGFVAAAIGCGSSTSSGTTGTGGSNGASSCPLPNCLKSLAPDCSESGACTTQTDLSADNWNTCYANGIKESVITDPSTFNMTLTVKKGSSTCFSTAFSKSEVIAGTSAITVKSATGTNVASVKVDATSNLYKVTCTGGQEVVLDQSCSNVYPVSALMGSGCEEGACVP